MPSKDSRYLVCWYGQVGRLRPYQIEDAETGEVVWSGKTPGLQDNLFSWTGCNHAILWNDTTGDPVEIFVMLPSGWRVEHWKSESA